jgi:diacylglycerol kinase family enzyme
VRLDLVLNPVASSYRDAVRHEVEARLAAHHDLVVHETRRRGHASELAAAAARAGADAVVVLAGDGTLNEAAAGILGSPTALAALPGGSTNVFARTLGVAYDPALATEQLLAALADRSFRAVGVGMANERIFLFHLGAGYDAAVVSEIEERPQVKRYLAHPAFAFAAVDTWLRRFDRRTRIRAAVGQGAAASEVGEGPYVIVSNSSPYSYVARRAIRVAPQASLDRPLAVTVLRSLRASVITRATASAVARARWITSSPQVVQASDVDVAELSADRPFPWQVDGEYLGEVDRIDVRYLPSALTLVVPAPPAPGPGGR